MDHHNNSIRTDSSPRKNSQMTCDLSYASRIRFTSRHLRKEETHQKAHYRKPSLGTISSKEKGAYLTDLQKPWRRVPKQVTVLYWRDYGGEKVNALVRELQDKFGFLPSWEDCHKAAEDADLELPTGLADDPLRSAVQRIDAMLEKAIVGEQL